MPAPHGFVERLAALSRSGTPFVSVTMVDAVGSTPQDTGSKMLVTGDGLCWGTVGGGKVEAIAHRLVCRSFGTHGLVSFDVVKPVRKRV